MSQADRINEQPDPTLAPDDQAWLRSVLEYSVGNEHNPADPFGRCVLTLVDDSARLDVHTRDGRCRSWTGRVDQADVERLRGALEDSGFPEVPPHVVVAGSAIRRLQVRDGARSAAAQLGYYEARSMPGYDEVFALLDTAIVLLTAGAVPVVPLGTDPVAVTDVAMVTST